MKKSYDVVIVGGAVVGSAIAYFLAAERAFGGSILVVEKDPSYADCSTTRSWGCIRQQFSTPENIKMSLYGARFFKSIGEYLSVDGEAPRLDFIEAGYLFLIAEEKLASFKANHEVQLAHGAAVALLTPEELAQRFPALELSGVAAGSLGLRNEGWIDPSTLMHAFRRKARALGATYLKDEVVSIARTGNRVTGARLRHGGEVACAVVINAAGSHAGQVARMAGLELPVGPYKVVTFVFDCQRPISHAPNTIDVSGLVFRPEGEGYITILPPGPEDESDTFDFEIDYARFEERVWPILAHRVPAFEAIKMTGAWAGHYDFNYFDHNAILGPHPEVTGLMFANGFSGHGLQQSPATGRALMELITFGGYRALDLGRLSYERVLKREPLEEANVI